MKIIDLLNKIANGEEVPKKIHFKYSTYQFDEIDKVYRNINGTQQLEQDYMISNKLNDEVEIMEEEKKIPEKLDVISWDKCIHGVTHKEKELAIEINKTQELLNQVLDYLKSKGE